MLTPCLQQLRTTSLLSAATDDRRIPDAISGGQRASERLMLRVPVSCCNFSASAVCLLHAARALASIS